MELAAAALLFNLLLIPFTIGYGLVAIVRGRLKLTRSRTLQGYTARLAGAACVILAILFWRFSVAMWSLIDG